MYDGRCDVSIAHPKIIVQSMSSSGPPNFSLLIPALMDALACKHKKTIKKRHGFLLWALDRFETGPSVNSWPNLAHLQKLLSVICAVLEIIHMIVKLQWINIMYLKKSRNYILTLGLLRGLEDRPVDAPLTERDLFPTPRNKFYCQV